MIIFEVIKYKAWKLATSHCTHSISSRPAEIGVFTSLEKNLQSHFSEHWRALRLQVNALYTLILKLVWWQLSVILRTLCTGFSRRLSLLLTCTHLGHQHRVTVTRGCTETICLSWWWALCAQNM